jgi:hypothetical protein
MFAGRFQRNNQTTGLLLVVHGTSAEVERAKSVLQSANVTTSVHAEPAVVAK